MLPLLVAEIVSEAVFDSLTLLVAEEVIVSLVDGLPLIVAEAVLEAVCDGLPLFVADLLGLTDTVNGVLLCVIVALMLLLIEPLSLGVEEGDIVPLVLLLALFVPLNVADCDVLPLLLLLGETVMLPLDVREALMLLDTVCDGDVVTLAVPEGGGEELALDDALPEALLLTL